MTCITSETGTAYLYEKPVAHYGSYYRLKDHDIAHSGSHFQLDQCCSGLNSEWSRYTQNVYEKSEDTTAIIISQRGQND
jgi:hypothetical protein